MDFLQSVFGCINYLLNYKIVIFGYDLSLWGFMVGDVVLSGLLFLIFRSFFDND